MKAFKGVVISPDDFADFFRQAGQRGLPIRWVGKRHFFFGILFALKICLELNSAMIRLYIR